MRVECKYCKRNLTSKAIELLQGKVDKVTCGCSEEEARELRKKIAEQFNLFTAYHDGEIEL
tara:strand:- start:374 stop:556 length:183 start_codon:yes stop_codon:yes gene_type:complete